MDVKLIFEMQKLGYVVDENNYEEMLKAYSVLKANKMGVKQVVTVDQQATKPIEEFVSFPEYSGTIHQATVIPSSGVVKVGDTRRIEKANLRVRYSPESKTHKITLIYTDEASMKAAGITGRSMIPNKALDVLNMDAKVRSGLEKVANSLKDNTKQTRESPVVAVGDILFEFKSQKSKDGWSIENITNIKLLPDQGIPSKPVTPVPAKTSVVNTASLPKLVGFSAVLPKTDVAFINDPVLMTFGWHPKIDIASNNQDDIRNRIAEIMFSQKFPMLEWANKDTETFKNFDYKELTSGMTLDVKTIATDRNNLLLKKKNVVANMLADILTLILVEDMGLTYRIECYGFISKTNALKYIGTLPTCYMSQFDSYKIDKKFLIRFPFTW